MSKDSVDILTDVQKLRRATDRFIISRILIKHLGKNFPRALADDLVEFALEREDSALRVANKDLAHKNTRKDWPFPEPNPD